MDAPNVEAAPAPSLPYHEPAIVTILILSSFLLLLNVVNKALDRLVYCGLLGQVLIGIAWGNPGATWLPGDVQEVIVQLGYLGLILLVYQGGLHTSFKSLKANLFLSTAVALTGIGVPIALSYVLQPLFAATPLQAFAAGAALCSTSLGTTFTVLASSGLSSTRLGVVLTSAAIMDDVVGLVMVQVISNLGEADLNAVTIVRPVLVSVAFAVIVPLTCLFVVKPSTILLNRHRKSNPSLWVNKLLRSRHMAFAIHTGFLAGLVAAASYAGTSNLFSAYIAGAVISWWDSEVPHPVKSLEEDTDSKEKMAEVRERRPNQHHVSREAGDALEEDVIQQVQPGVDQKQEPEVGSERPKDASPDEDTSGSIVYERYYQQAVSRILQPLFFASIGFSIPITRMFEGPIVWRGIVYAILMAFGKLVCGLWLVRFSVLPFRDSLTRVFATVRRLSIPHIWWTKARGTGQSRPPQEGPRNVSNESNPHTSPAPKPLSLHPPLILACAMVARGEIGFLVSAVAESNGIFSSNRETGSESDIFLIVTWAIVLCTILGPLGVGLLVRRVKGLEEKKNRQQEGSGRDVLGVWGVN